MNGNTLSKKVVNTIFKRMVDNEKTLMSMTTNLTMVRYDAILNLSETATGTFVYLPKAKRRNMYLRIDWSKPDERISVIGDAFELYRPRLNQVIYGKINKLSVHNSLKFVNMSKDTLDKSYSVMYLGRTKTISGLKMSNLRVTSKLDSDYLWAELWIDKRGILRQIKILDRYGPATTILLSDIKKNVTVKGEIFKLHYPRSVKRVKL